MELLSELVALEDCYFVKYYMKPRDGMYLGRCFFTTEARVGEVWAKYKAHPKVFCSIQNDDMTEKYRKQVKSWGM